MGDYESNNPNQDIIVEQGEFRTMRDPRSGQLKEVDMSIAALSRTMEQIRKSAEIINQPSTSFSMAMSRFDYIKELVLDHAQFSPKLKNLQIRIIDKTIEIVNDIEELDIARISYARNYFIGKARAELAKDNRVVKADRKRALEKAIEVINSGFSYLKDDKETLDYFHTLKEELDALQS